MRLTSKSTKVSNSTVTNQSTHVSTGPLSVVNNTSTSLLTSVNIVTSLFDIESDVTMLTDWYGL